MLQKCKMQKGVGIQKCKMQEGVGLALVGARDAVHALDALDDSGYSVCDAADE
jgi:hypothetical protein